MMTVQLAFDQSARRIDADGRLHISRSHISKAAINPYYGREIPGYEELGLDPAKIYRLFRDPVELEKAAPSFARLPILKEHVPISVESHRPDLVAGTVGSEVEFDAPYLDADLCIWDKDAIAGIESQKIRELSCAYRYVPLMEPDEFEGQAYDGKMTQIEGNHLALVEVGRAGPDVVVADQSPFILKENAMKMTKTGKAVFAALCALSPTLAQDSSLPALVGKASRKTFNRVNVKSKIMAIDSDIDPEQLDNIIDAILDVEQEPKPMEAPTSFGDQSPVEMIRGLLEGKVDPEIIEQICSLWMPEAEDEKEEDKGMKPEEVKAAMDGLRRELREAADAAKEVRSVVGDLSMDSAAEIYAFALDHMKVDHKDVSGVPALRALFRVASSTKSVPSSNIAQDSAGLAARFPNATRFRKA